MRVIIADDHPAILVGLIGILDRHPARLCVQARAHSGEDLLDKLKSNPCDLLVTDFNMPCGAGSLDGFELLKKVRRAYPKLPVLVLTFVDNPALFRGILQLGIQAVVSKAAATTELLAAIDAVIAERTYLSEQARQPLPEGSSQGKTRGVSAREADVLRQLLSGLTVSEIARRSGKSVVTISAQKQSAMRKLGVSTTAQLFEYALSQDMI